MSVILGNATKNVWNFLISRKLQFCIKNRFLIFLSLICDKEMEKKISHLVKTVVCMECQGFATELLLHPQPSLCISGNRQKPQTKVP